MIKSDWYLGGVVVINIYFFTKITELSLLTPLSSILEHGSMSAYGVFIIFIVGVVLVLNTLSHIVRLCTEDVSEEAQVAAKRSVGIQTLLLLTTYTFLELFSAYHMYDVYGTF